MRVAPPAPKIAIFDIDGTLINSQRKLTTDVQEAFQRLNIALEPSQIEGSDWYELARQYSLSREQFDKEFKKRKSWEESLRAGEAPLFPDTIPCLEILMKEGVTLCALTRSTPKCTYPKIEHHGLSRYFGNRVAITPIQAESKKAEARALIQRLSLAQDSEIYFIGDRPEDVLVAEQMPEYAHTRGVYLNRTPCPAPESVKTNIIIKSLEKLPDIILGGW